MFSCYVLYIISSEEIEKVQNLDVTSLDFGRDGCADLSSIYSRLYVVCSLSGRKFSRRDSVMNSSGNHLGKCSEYFPQQKSGMSPSCPLSGLK